MRNQFGVLRWLDQVGVQILCEIAVGQQRKTHELSIVRLAAPKVGCSSWIHWLSGNAQRAVY
jgi:hypothetical protein